MTLSKYFLAAALVTALGAGPVLAQAPAAAPATTAAPAAPMAAKPAAPMAAPAAKGAKPARTDASLACSKDADTKNIHGKPRKKFMSECKKAGGPK